MPGDTIQVLHVDDNADFGDLTAAFIERDYDDITIETETDPRQCLEHLDHDSGSIDCIVSDYDMPHLNGLEMLEAVRSEYPGFPFILFTGKGSEEIAAEAITKGIDDYMQKEVGTDQYAVLANRIKHHVSRVRTEQALRNSEEKYRALVEQNIVGIYLVDEFTFTYVNPRLADVFGYTQDELIGMAPRDIVAPHDRDRVDANLQKRLDGDVDTIRYQFTGQHKDGTEREVLVQGRRIELNDHPAIAGVLLDLDTLPDTTYCS